MSLALEQAKLAALKGEVPVGAIIVEDSQVIAQAHNETEHGQNATQHAELLAINRACQKLARSRLTNCSLYVTLEPCPMCIGAILLARIDTLYFGANDPSMGAVGSVFDLSQHPLLPGKVRVYSGLLAEECGGELRRFFETLRR